uniref:Uncharacterized protein n=1 Tax=Knipowitschia caucasica TaxID=637954 RepID=A0AAV2M638_KNICA
MALRAGGQGVRWGDDRSLAAVLSYFHSRGSEGVWSPLTPRWGKTGPATLQSWGGACPPPFIRPPVWSPLHIRDLVGVGVGFIGPDSTGCPRIFYCLSVPCGCAGVASDAAATPSVHKNSTSVFHVILHSAYVVAPLQMHSHSAQAQYII